ncbi:DUF6907 domain-containing protein [Kitasatospora sp. NBC_01302]|uniref:DUF6907 domain-containing protein n=1 Tax=Kitasatospora sp. NBC_01302 TaxID=2903575 RepID=UPI002E126FD3|nr:hypothetical protein OG294_27690 [Kitasatospora sp. NBC_01302]
MNSTLITGCPTWCDHDHRLDDDVHQGAEQHAVDLHPYGALPGTSALAVQLVRYGLDTEIALTAGGTTVDITPADARQVAAEIRAIATRIDQLADQAEEVAQ